MKKILVIGLLATSTSLFAFNLNSIFKVNSMEQKSICGVDDRVFSYDTKIGRAQDTLDARGGCTITMIGKTCAISAGHCHSVLKFVEFNPKHPDAQGQGGHADPADIYEVDQSSLVYKYSYSEDWSVFRLKPHATTGKLAGEVYGTYPVSFEKPKNGSIVRITGYGIDRVHPERYCTQQTHSGPITKLGFMNDNISYKVDTEPGNSGSAVILEDTGEIVAIHTNGGCSEYDGSNANSGTLISNNKKLQKAITNCLNADL